MPIVPILIAGVSTLVSGFLSLGLDILRKKVNNKIADDSFNRLNEIILTTVKSVEQTVVKELKETGSFSRQSQDSIKAKALREVKRVASKKVLKEASNIIGDIDTYLNDKLESVILDRKEKDV